MIFKDFRRTTNDGVFFASATSTGHGLLRGQVHHSVQREVAGLIPTSLSDVQRIDVGAA